MKLTLYILILVKHYCNISELNFFNCFLSTSSTHAWRGVGVGIMGEGVIIKVDTGLQKRFQRK